MRPLCCKNFITSWILSLTILLSCNIEKGLAQEGEVPGKNIISIEGLGAGGFYSLSYGREVYKKDNYKVVTKIGFSTYHIRDFTNSLNPDLIFPLGMQIEIGKIHQLVAGLGNTVSSIVQLSNRNFKPERQWQNHGYLLLGYQFQKLGSPFQFGIGYTPLFERYKDFRHWGMISIGRMF